MGIRSECILDAEATRPQRAVPPRIADRRPEDHAGPCDLTGRSAATSTVTPGHASPCQRKRHHHGEVDGIAIAFNSAWLLLTLAIFALVIRYGVIAREEAYLERKFGEVYRDYRGRVRRWL